MTRDSDWLRDTLDAIDRVYWRDELERRGVSIRWARFRKTTKSFRCSAWWPDKLLIEVNPVLSQDWVPDEFVVFSIYHETIHAMRDAQMRGHSTHYQHDPSFREAEMKYPHFAEAEHLEAENLKALIAARIEVRPC